MPFRIVRNDIVRMPVDAIVNAANSALMRGGGVCGAIFEAAGSEQMTAACDAIGHCNTGEAVATPGFALPARHVIHTVGPVWQDGLHGEPEQLANCYRNVLELARELEDRTVAFPLISSGIYGYPRYDALDVAIREIRIYLAAHDDMTVYLVLYDLDSTLAAKGLVNDIQLFIDDVYIASTADERRRVREFDELYEADPGAWYDLDQAQSYAQPQAAGRFGIERFDTLPDLDEVDEEPEEYGDYGESAYYDDSAEDYDGFDEFVGYGRPNGFGAGARDDRGFSRGARSFIPLPSPSRTDMPDYAQAAEPEEPLPAAPPPRRQRQSIASRISELFHSVSPEQASGRNARDDINDLIVNLDASFSQTLLQLIDERGLSDSVVYKRANMSRQHFSKIRSQAGYRPKKQTVLALALALELSLDDTKMLLERAGYAFSHADKRDVIVEYFIRRGQYDVFEINCALYDFDQVPLG